MNSEPTLTQGIIFCDQIIREQGTGKISYIGTFHNYNLPQFPVQIPPFFVSAFISNITEANEIDVTTRIENPKNGMVMSSIAVKVAFQKKPERNEMHEIYMPIFNLVFHEAGLYKAVILVNNEKVGERDLLVRDIRASTQPQ